MPFAQRLFNKGKVDKNTVDILHELQEVLTIFTTTKKGKSAESPPRIIKKSLTCVGNGIFCRDVLRNVTLRESETTIKRTLPL